MVEVTGEAANWRAENGVSPYFNAKGFNFPFDEWLHIAGVVSTEEQTATLYKNGVYETSSNSEGVSSSDSNLYLGIL